MTGTSLVPVIVIVIGRVVVLIGGRKIVVDRQQVGQLQRLAGGQEVELPCPGR